MKERPILFKGAMVRAILDGSKTQTRRIVKPQVLNVGGATPWEWKGTRPKSKTGTGWIASTHLDGLLSWLKYSCPYGKPGDRLWVRETWGKVHHEGVDPLPTYFYRADEYDAERDSLIRWKPSLFMPRWASRITLEVVSVRVERLNDISEEDAKREGADPVELLTDVATGLLTIPMVSYNGSYVDGYAALWESINGPGSWAVNPWVWVVEFRKINTP